jgi:prepilin-type N-terminal cleavage/methylation domain-containing protein
MNSYKLTSVQGKQQGYTLVELAISVAILSVLIVAGLLGVQSILTSGKVNDQIKTVAKLAAKSSAMFASSANGTTGVTQQQMINMGAWDVSKTNGGNVNSSFGSRETIIPNAAAIGAPGAMPANTGFVYRISNVPQAACADLANGLSGFVFALNITAVSGPVPADWSTGNAAVKPPGAANVTLANMANSCNNANSDFLLAIKP